VASVDRLHYSEATKTGDPVVTSTYSLPSFITNAQDPLIPQALCSRSIPCKFHSSASSKLRWLSLTQFKQTLSDQFWSIIDNTCSPLVTPSCKLISHILLYRACTFFRCLLYMQHTPNPEHMNATHSNQYQDDNQFSMRRGVLVLLLNRRDVTRPTASGPTCLRNPLQSQSLAFSSTGCCKIPPTAVHAESLRRRRRYT
jgi:hypothetical protein